MDDSDLALDLALQRLDRESETSDIEEESQADGVSLDMYTPNMANTAYGVCRRGSLQNSGSEDSNSMSSFCTDSDVGPARSAVYCRPSRGLTNNIPARCAMSDSETSRPRKLGRNSGACLAMNISVPVEDFFLRIRERLMAVSKDRDAMTRKVQDLARQKGHTFEEIMAAEWYELPEARKYLITRTPTDPGEEPLEEESNIVDDDEMVPSPRLTISPSELTPRSTMSLGEMGCRNSSSSRKQMKEVEDAMRNIHVNHVNNQVTRKRSHRHISGGSSVLSATSDSGVGDTWVKSGLTTPSNDRIHAYLHGQNLLTTSLPPREREAQAAAIALISNSPQPESLNPQVPLHLARQQQQQQQQHRHHQRMHHHQEPEPHHHHQSRQHRLTGHYSSGDDSSSVFTMTSQSSTSDLFIPRKPQHSVYTDSEEPHHYGNTRYRRMLSTPKRSNRHAPSPLTEQHRQLRPTQSPQQSDMMLSHPQHPISHTSGGGGGGSVGSGAGGGMVHVIYHLDNIPTPFHAKWNNGVGITLRTFKEQVFARKGDYRFFFESFNPDLDMSLFEEFTEDDVCLPVSRGKIVGRVEKAQ